jgi:hypothetical protein
MASYFHSHRSVAGYLFQHCETCSITNNSIHHFMLLRCRRYPRRSMLASLWYSHGELAVGSFGSSLPAARFNLIHLLFSHTTRPDFSLARFPGPSARSALGYTVATALRRRLESGTGRCHVRSREVIVHGLSLDFTLLAELFDRARTESWDYGWLW